MKTSLISLAATLLLAANFSSTSARDIKYSAVNVNDNWYYCGQYLDWCGGAFNSANLGVITSLELGGQSQVSTGNDWGGGTMTMGYTIDGGNANYITLTYYGYTGTYNQLQSGGSNYSNTTIDISSLSFGKHTIAVWFQSEDAYDSNYNNNYVASFVKLEGNGSADTPYLIKTTDDLDALAITVNNGTDYEGEYFKLLNNLNYANKTYTPIGTYIEDAEIADRPFMGIFDGNYKTISNITVNEPSKNFVGVFGNVSGYGSEIINLIVSNSSFTGDQYVGGIAGYNEGGVIKCCYNSSVSVKGENSVGGIAGYSSAYITESSQSGTVSGTLSEIGGIVGNNCGTIEGCYCNATISGDGYANMLGGIAGSLEMTAIISDCIFEGTVTGYSGSSKGGILGEDLTMQAEAPGRKEAIARTNEDDFYPLTRNYYVATEVLGVGDDEGGHDINQNDGAVPSYKFDELPFAIGDPMMEYSEIGITAYESCLYYGFTYYFSFVQLDDQGDNESILTYFDDAKPSRFKINGRTLYKDGDWNTLCLPFSLGDNDEEDELTFSGTPLEGAIVKTLESSTLSDDGTLTLNFSEDLTSIDAGYAYLVKWEKPNGYDQSPASFDIKDPTFTDVIHKSTAPVSSFEGDFAYLFTGNFNPYQLTPGEQTELYLGAENTLYYPAEDHDVTIGAFRGFFQKTTPIDAPIRAIKLNFGDDTNSIQTIFNEATSNDDYYTIDGRHLNGKPSTSGLFIHNGRKIIIK